MQVLEVNGEAWATTTSMARYDVSGRLDCRHLDYENLHLHRPFCHHPAGYGDAYLVVEDKDQEDHGLARTHDHVDEEAAVVVQNQVRIHGEEVDRGGDDVGGRLAAGVADHLRKSWAVGHSY